MKLTVNYDDPGTYHLYYGDNEGHPGTILTFFPWPGATKGIKGTGQLTVISFSVPEDAMKFWMNRFESHGIAFERPFSRFDEKVLSFRDPDGLQLELVAKSFTEDGRKGWEDGPIAAEHAVRGYYGVTLSEEGYEKTSSLLTSVLGFRLVRKESDRSRFEVGDGGPGTAVDVLCEPDKPQGFVSVGTVHHVAWRTPDDEQQRNWRDKISNAGLNVTPIIDRNYFHSIYFREPGGVLFEIATDPPGFTVDEPIERLGSQLRLPPRLEPLRSKLEQLLPPVHIPHIAQSH